MASDNTDRIVHQLLRNGADILIWDLKILLHEMVYIGCMKIINNSLYLMWTNNIKQGRGKNPTEVSFIEVLITI